MSMIAMSIGRGEDIVYVDEMTLLTCKKQSQREASVNRRHDRQMKSPTRS
jgi:hypothetical protein